MNTELNSAKRIPIRKKIVQELPTKQNKSFYFYLTNLAKILKIINPFSPGIL